MTPRPFQFARRMSRMKASAVREILKVTEQPDILSFAGGLPAPELFPVSAIADAHARVFSSAGPQALQYSTTEGFGPLRDWIGQWMGVRGCPTSAQNVLLTHGSQQGIDLACKVLLSPGDQVVVENPSYLAALQVFGGYEVDVRPVASDDDGMRMDALEAELRRGQVRMLYLTPTFQNPKGTTLSLERRKRLVELVAEFGVPVVEDDPYGELRYAGERLPTLASLAVGKAEVIFLSTFSKTLAPGLRIGWAVASDPIIRAMAVAKQSTDLHTNSLSQRAVAELLSRFDLDVHVANLRRVYGERRQAMLDGLDAHFPKEAQWTRPQGGLFLWCQLPEGLRTDSLLQASLKEKVAFVPGDAFFTGPPGHPFMRLNFSNRPPEAIREGMGRLGRVIARASNSGRESPVVARVAPVQPW